MSEPIQRFAAVDIETTALDASYGRLICICIKHETEDKVRTKYIRWSKDELSLLKWMQKQYEDIDVLITWNGKRFDIPFINARLMRHGLSPLEPKKHMDLMYQAMKLRTRGARLDGFAKDMGLEYQKIDVPASDWVLAAEGNANAVKRIVEHCERDVHMTQEAAVKCRPMIVRITR